MSKSKSKLSVEARSARAAYLRDWYKKNPDKNREYITRYWEHRAKKVAEKNESECNNEKI